MGIRMPEVGDEMSMDIVSDMLVEAPPVRNMWFKS